MLALGRGVPFIAVERLRGERMVWGSGHGADGKGGVRPSVVGEVQGEGGTGAVSGGAGVAWACCWRSGAPRAGVCWPGWSWHGHARQVLDRLSAGMAPANAGIVRGLARWG